MGRGEAPLDWGMAEHLAFGSLVTDGTCSCVYRDKIRAAVPFSHRHSVLIDQRTEAEFTPLENLSRQASRASSCTTRPLSEAGVLGFDYGYSLDYPDGLVMWEGQFGDFVNGAQVIIDQFIVSAEDKWHRLSGVVLLLPHGYEGQGAEHSSARLERFFDAAAEDNIQICYPSHAGAIFPHAAATSRTQVAQAARGHDAKEFVAFA